MFQVEESELDRLHSEQQTQGDNKYSTIQKVTMIDLLLARSGFGVGGGGGVMRGHQVNFRILIMLYNLQNRDI